MEQVISGQGLPEWQQLQLYVAESCRKEENFHFLRFESLQRLNIVRLQNELAKLKSQSLEQELSQEQYRELSTTLHQYSTAIRDYDAIHSLPRMPHNEMNLRLLRLRRYFPEIGRLSKQPLASHYHYASQNAGVRQPDVLRQWLQHYLPVRLTYSSEEKIARQDEYLSSQPPCGISSAVDVLARLAIACTGGAFLIVPMLIMILHPSLTKSLITVCVAVVLFAFAIAFGIQLGNGETLVSTATYAAFLVVFVGTNTS